MAYLILGLGNPGEEYARTRHNAGRMALELLWKKYNKEEDLSDWKMDKKRAGLLSKGEMGEEKVELVLPETFMNKSGTSVKDLAGSAKKIEKMIVVHDDMDLPLGKMKISFDKSSGGHKGVESIIRAVKSQKFVRVRIGVTPATASGKLKKPEGEEKVMSFIVGKLKPAEEEILKKTLKRVAEAVEMIVEEGREKAMGSFN